jgi:phage terminase large subunit-like protein
VPSRRRKTKPRSTSRKRDRAAVRDPVAAYAEAVVAGTIIAGPHVRNACRRHLDDLKHGAARGLVWDAKAAVRAIGFCKDVLHLAGGQFEGTPFVLQPSQAFRMGSLFGWKRIDGTRRFRRFYDEEGKGNGKSPLLAAIGLLCMVADGEARAEVYAAGSKKDQAMVLFRDAVAMVDQSPALSSRLTRSGGNPVWNLADPHSGSFFRPISSDDGQSGPRPSCALCDEVHEHRDGTTIELLERGFKWRRQPLLVMATNSGTDRQSVCWEEHQHAVRVAAGTRTPDETFAYVGEPIDDETFAYVCALDKDDDPLEDPGCWVKANPLLGVTVREDYLASVVRQAKQIPGKLNGILRLHFCVWTDAADAWMARATLEAVLADFDPLVEHAGRPCRAGLDLSGSQDLTAAAFCVQTGTVELRRGEKVLTLPTFDAWVEAWTPRDTLTERALRDQAPYEVWVKGGWLNAVEGRNIRLDFVAARVAEVNADCPIDLLAYDRYAYRKFEEELDRIGLTLPQAEHPQGGVRRARPTPEQIEDAKRQEVEPPQGLWMPGSVLELENLILEKRIRIRRNPVLISAMMSAAVEHDAFDNRWFSKRRAVNRIDPLVALAMAVGAATSQTAPAAGPSVYEQRGILML